MQPNKPLKQTVMRGTHFAEKANHAEDKKLEKKLEALYDKISDIENKYL